MGKTSQRAVGSVRNRLRVVGMAKLKKGPRLLCKNEDCTNGVEGTRHNMDSKRVNALYCCVPCKNYWNKKTRRMRSWWGRARKFLKRHHENPKIFQGIIEYCLLEKALSVKYISVHWAHINVCKSMKIGICNNDSSFYSRLLTKKYPELNDVIKQVD